MIERFGSGIRFDLGSDERVLLGLIPVLLDDVGVTEGDPAADRLRVPVYLDAPESNEAWWLLMGEELGDARDSDRTVYRKIVRSDVPIVVSEEDADAFLRVLNEGRLALGARLGVEVEEDHDRLSESDRVVFDFLGWVLELLTDELSRDL